MNDFLQKKNVETLVIIVNFNGGKYLTQCIESLIRQYYEMELVVIDNGSQDGSDIEVATNYPMVELISSPVNLGFGAAINYVASHYSYNEIVILNPDVVLQDNCLKKMQDHLMKFPGVVGPVLNNSKESGMKINHIGMPSSCSFDEVPLFIQGCVIMTNRKVFEAVGGFDERYFLFVEDVEFSWRALIAGFEVSVANDAHASHVGGASIEGGYFEKGKKYSTSVFRIRLRERNSIALLISCAPGWWFPILLPALIIHFLFILSGSILIGSTELSKSILSGLFWNFKEFRRSIDRRNSLCRSSYGVRRANKRIKFGSPMVSVIRESGLPRLI